MKVLHGVLIVLLRNRWVIPSGKFSFFSARFSSSFHLTQTPEDENNDRWEI
jgi:hypothetical protein